MSTEFSSLASQEYFNKKWINPSSLAIAASIGLHGVVLGLVWPNLSSWSQDESTAVEAPVDVIELNAAEQARLPDLEPKPVNFEDLADLGKLPDTNPSSLQLPPLASNLPSPLSGLPPITSLPPLAFNNRIPIAPFSTTIHSLPQIAHPRLDPIYQHHRQSVLIKHYAKI